MNILPNFFCFLSLLAYLSCSVVHSQNNYNSDYSASIERKPIVDYYDTIDDKSFYQLKRIHGMKGELNSYSQKLHTLQDRFDKIFYGLSSKGNFKTPFDTSVQPTRPVINSTPKPPSPFPVRQEVEYPVAEFPQETASPENQLAFNVSSPGTFTQDEKVISTFNPHSNRGVGYYFIISPGVSFSTKIHKRSDSYKRFDPGFSTTFAGGFKVGDFKIGLGGVYKNHSFHEDSKLKPSGLALTGDSETFAGYLDLGYNLKISNSWDAYFGLGIGYYLTLIDDNKDLSTRKEHDVFLTASTGISWRMSELFSLSLGYRYFHENEVPAHIAELGANFDF
ncbi:MAG: outer membrane beta-barrel protein [Opitutales bacterium]|nr:outer membrane beta-barrel protein [Opitutales bacterium]